MIKKNDQGTDGWIFQTESKHVFIINQWYCILPNGYSKNISCQANEWMDISLSLSLSLSRNY
jgi:hypothetical protein